MAKLAGVAIVLAAASGAAGQESGAGSFSDRYFFRKRYYLQVGCSPAQIEENEREETNTANT